MFRTRNALIAAVAAGALLVSPAPQSAASSLPTDGPNVSGPAVGPAPAVTIISYSRLGSERGLTGIASPALIGGPGCDTDPYGMHVNPPYEYEGLARSIGYIDCLIDYQVLTITQDLQRSRWYGWQSLAEPGETLADTNFISVDPSWKCLGVGTYTYQDPTEGAGELAGTWYYATGNNSDRFNC